MFVSLCEALGMPVNKEMSKINRLIHCILNLPAYVISTLATSLLMMTITPYSNDIQDQSQSLINKLERIGKQDQKMRQKIEKLKKMLKGIKNGFKSAFKILKSIFTFLFNFASPITWITWVLIILVTFLTLMSVLVGRYGTFQGELTIDIDKMRSLNQDESEYTDLLNEAALRQSFFESVSDSSFYQAFSVSDAAGKSASINDAIKSGFLNLFDDHETDSRTEKLRLKYGQSQKGNADTFGERILEFLGITIPSFDKRSILADANMIQADYLMQAEALGSYSDSFGMTSYFRDYWGREENFTLSSDLLYELNRWIFSNGLSDEKIIYPEAFTQPVAYVYDYCRICTDRSSPDYGNPYVYITQRVTLEDINNPQSKYYGWNAYEGIIVSEPSTIVYDYATVIGGLATQPETIQYADGTREDTQKIVRLYWRVKASDEARTHQMDLNADPSIIFEGPYLTLNDGILSDRLAEGDVVNVNGYSIAYKDNQYPQRHYQLVSITDTDGDIQVSSRNLFNRSYVKVPVVRPAYRNSDDYWDGFDNFIYEDQQKAPYNQIRTAGCTYQDEGQMTICRLDDNGCLVSVIEPDDWTKKQGSVILYYYGISDCIHTISTIVDNIRGEGSSAIEEADAQVIIAILLEYENYLCSYGTEGVEWEYAYHTYAATDKDDVINQFYTGANIFKHLDNKEDATRYVATYDAAINLNKLSTLSTEYVSVGVSSCLNDPDGEIWGWRVVLQNGLPVGIKKVYGEVSYEFPEYYTEEQGKIWTEGTWRIAYNIDGGFLSWPTPTDLRSTSALDKDTYKQAIPKQWQYGGYNFVNKWTRANGKYILRETTTGIEWNQWRYVLRGAITLNNDKYDIAYHSIPSDYDNEDSIEDISTRRLLYDIRNEDEAWNPDAAVYRPDATTQQMVASIGDQKGRVTSHTSASDYLAMELKSVRDYGLGSVLSYIDARKVTYISGLAVTEAADTNKVKEWFKNYFAQTIGEENVNKLVNAALDGMYASSLLKETADVDGKSVTLESILCGQAVIQVKNPAGNDWINLAAVSHGKTLSSSDLKRIADGLNLLQGSGNSVYKYNNMSFTVSYAQNTDDINTSVSDGFVLMMKIDDTWYVTNIHVVIPFLQPSKLQSVGDDIKEAWQKFLRVFNWGRAYTDDDAEAEATNQFFDPESYYQMWYDFNTSETADDWYRQAIESAVQLITSEGLVDTYDNATAKALRETIDRMEISGAAGSPNNDGFFASIWSYLFPDTSAGQYVTTDQLAAMAERFDRYVQPLSLIDETATGEVYLIEEAVTFLGNFLYTYDTQLLIAGDLMHEDRIVSGVTYADRYSALSHYIFKAPVETRTIRVTDTLYSSEKTLTINDIKSILKLADDVVPSMDVEDLLTKSLFRNYLEMSDPAYAESMPEQAVQALNLKRHKDAVEQIACISNVQLIKSGENIKYRWIYRYFAVYKSNGILNDTGYIYIDSGKEIQELCAYLEQNNHEDVAEKIIIEARVYTKDELDGTKLGQNYSLVDENGFRDDYLSHHPYSWAFINKTNAAYADYGFTSGHYDTLTKINNQIDKSIKKQIVFTADSSSTLKIDSDGNYDDIGIDAPNYTTSLIKLSADDISVVAEAIYNLYGSTYNGGAYFIQMQSNNTIVDFGDNGCLDFYPDPSCVFGLKSYYDSGIWNTIGNGFTTRGQCGWTIDEFNRAIPNSFKVAANVKVVSGDLVLNDENAAKRAECFRSGYGDDVSYGRYPYQLYCYYQMNEITADDVSVGVAIANRQRYGTVLPTYTGIYGSKVQVAPKLTGAYFNEEVYANWINRISEDEESSEAKSQYLLNYHDSKMSYLYDYLSDFETYLPLSVMSDADLHSRGIDSYRSISANTNMPLDYSEDYIKLIQKELSTPAWQNIYGGYVIATAGISGYNISTDAHLAANVSNTEYVIDDISMAQLVAGLIETSYEYGPYIMIEHLNVSRTSDKIEHSYDNYTRIRDAMDSSRFLRPADGLPSVTLVTESGASVSVSLLYVGACAIPNFNTGRTLSTNDIAEGVEGFGSVDLSDKDRLDPEKSVKYTTVKFGKLLYKYGNVSSAIMAYFYGEEYWDELLKVAKLEGESTGPEWKTDNSDLISSAVSNLSTDSMVYVSHLYPLHDSNALDNNISNFYTAEVVEYALCFVSEPTARLRMIRLTTSSLGSAAVSVGLRASYAADMLERWENGDYCGSVQVNNTDSTINSSLYHYMSWQYVDDFAAEYGVDVGLVVALAMEASGGNPYYGLFTSSVESGSNGLDYRLTSVVSRSARKNGIGMFAIPDNTYFIDTLRFTTINKESLNMDRIDAVGLTQQTVSFPSVKCYDASDKLHGIAAGDKVLGKTAKGKEQILKTVGDFKNEEEAGAYVNALDGYLSTDMRYTMTNVTMPSSGNTVSIPTSAQYVVLRLARLYQNNNVLEVIYEYFRGMYPEDSLFKYTMNELKQKAYENGYGTNWYSYYDSIVSNNRIKTVLEYYNVSLAMETESSITITKSINNRTKIESTEEKAFILGRYAVLADKKIVSTPLPGYAVTTISHNAKKVVNHISADDVDRTMSYIGTNQTYFYDMNALLRYLESECAVKINTVSFECGEWYDTETDQMVPSTSVYNSYLHKSAFDGSAHNLQLLVDAVNRAAEFEDGYNYLPVDGYSDDWGFHYTLKNVPTDMTTDSTVDLVTQEYYKMFNQWKANGIIPRSASFSTETDAETDATTYSVVCAYRDNGIHIQEKVYAYTTGSSDEAFDAMMHSSFKDEYGTEMLVVAAMKADGNWEISDGLMTPAEVRRLEGLNDVLKDVKGMAKRPVSTTVCTVSVNIFGNDLLYCDNGEWPNVDVCPPSLIIKSPTIQYSSYITGSIDHDKIFGTLTLLYDETSSRPVSDESECLPGEKYVSLGYNVTSTCTWHFSADTSWNIVSNGYSLTAAGLFSNTSAFNEFTQDRLAEYVSGITVFDSSPFGSRKDIDLAVMSVLANEDDPFKSLYDYSLLSFFTGTKKMVQTEERSWMQVSAYHSSYNGSVPVKVVLSDVGQRTVNPVSDSDLNDFPPLIPFDHNVINTIGSNIVYAYGKSENPLTGGTTNRHGVVLSVPNGTLIQSFCDGIIVEVGHNVENGNYVVVEYAVNGISEPFSIVSSTNGDRYRINGVRVLYGYLDSKPDDAVLYKHITAGSSIPLESSMFEAHAHVGISGHSTGNQLYIEVLVNVSDLDENGNTTTIPVWETVDPQPYLTASWR